MPTDLDPSSRFIAGAYGQSSFQQNAAYIYRWVAPATPVFSPQIKISYYFTTHTGGLTVSQYLPTTKLDYASGLKNPFGIPVNYYSTLFNPIVPNNFPVSNGATQIQLLNQDATFYAGHEGRTYTNFGNSKQTFINVRPNPGDKIYFYITGGSFGETFRFHWGVGRRLLGNGRTWRATDNLQYIGTSRPDIKLDDAIMPFSFNGQPVTLAPGNYRVRYGRGAWVRAGMPNPITNNYLTTRWPIENNPNVLDGINTMYGIAPDFEAASPPDEIMFTAVPPIGHYLVNHHQAEEHAVGSFMDFYQATSGRCGMHFKGPGPDVVLNRDVDWSFIFIPNGIQEFPRPVNYPTFDLFKIL